MRKLLREIHRRSLWQVLGIYLVGAWIGYSVIQGLTEGLGLPEWFPALALLLFIVGLPIVLATAFVQRSPSSPDFSDPTLLPDADVVVKAQSREPSGAPRWFTWRNAILGGVTAFALWGFFAAGWLLTVGTTERTNSAAAESVEAKSVAVLPLENMSAEPETDWFSDGMTEDIITQLSIIGDLKVISRTSVMRYKGEREKSLKQIGEELGVAAILEGSVRRSGDRVRITAQLIDAQTDEHLWAQTFDRQLTDVFEIQSEVALKIAAALQAELAPAELDRIERVPTGNLDAYSLYLQGRYHLNKRSTDGFNNAIEYFQQAIAIDPEYALAHVGLADCYLLLGIYYAWQLPGSLPVSEVGPKAKRAALKALEINSTLAEARTSYAFIIQTVDHDFTGATLEFRRAIELNPGYATAHHWFAINLAARGRYDEGLAESTRALELDPVSLIINNDHQFHLMTTGQVEAAVDQLLKTQELDPNFWRAHNDLSYIYAATGRYDEAFSEMEAAHLLKGRSPDDIAALRHAYDTAGWSAMLELKLEQQDALDMQGYSTTFTRALINAQLGRMDEAFRYVAEASDERSASLLLIRVSPAFSELRSDPRYPALLREVGLE
jgi:TolB-like protein/Flp pilus assembly protein TadD